MNIFQAVKSSVTARSAAELYIPPVSNNGMACCPFHDDRHPSMKVDERYFCFGCGATGDVIDLIAKLFGLPALNAANKLAADFGIGINAPQSRESVLAKLKHQTERDTENRTYRTLSGYIELLKIWRTDYAPKSPDEPLHERFLKSLHELDRLEYYLDVFIYGDSAERKELYNELREDLSNFERELNEYHAGIAADDVAADSGLVRRQKNQRSLVL